MGTETAAPNFKWQRERAELLGLLDEFLDAEAGDHGADYLLFSILPVLKYCVDTLARERPEHPNEALALRLLEFSGAPQALLAPLRAWAESSAGPGQKMDRGTVLTSKPLGLSQRLVSTLTKAASNNGHGTLDIMVLARLLSLLDPQWPWSQ